VAQRNDSVRSCSLFHRSRRTRGPFRGSFSDDVPHQVGIGGVRVRVPGLIAPFAPKNHDSKLCQRASRGGGMPQKRKIGAHTADSALPDADSP